ncbi:His Kinase A (phospho-acceptor) domain-containing protein [Bryocella elongata]|uniref:histidine kinase n=1 Tax=Bryocella elongata TaxID=863522 RepID=A0A1H6BXE8_9BACT|nr:ATP-binding protein [Bryocella elongata]SEG65384.1 His Kinase A (phospho-acceptor) domain-containing protein [Bryocella elongata]
MITFVITVLAVLVVVLSVCSIALGIAHARTRQVCDRLNRELATALREALHQQTVLKERRELDTIKDEFISTVSHELRTPLTSIRGALGLLSSGVMGKLDDKAANLLRIASSNTDRLVRLINDILDLERMDSGRAPLHIRRCVLHELVEHAVDTMTALAEAGEVRLDIVPEPAGDPITFDGDPDRFQQVLCNLLSNAIKFSPALSSVRVLTGSDGEFLVLRVEDQGRGVPPEKIETIFDRFSQVEASDARQKGGTGLGLAICRSIITQHAGSIWAERNDAHGSGRQGTTFTLRIPRMTSAAASAPAKLQGRIESTVLVVDDDDASRRTVVELLRRHGYQVQEASTGAEALAIAANQRIDLILLDLYMPGMSGWQTIERLKHTEATAAIPVVVISVVSPTDSGEELPLMAATEGWVKKPLNEGLLLTELARVLDLTHGRVPLLAKSFTYAPSSRLS